MIRSPFTEICYFHLPPIPFTDEQVSYMDRIHETHSQGLRYRTYKYPIANKVVYDSSEHPIDLFNDDADFLSIDNFWQLLPRDIQLVFENYFAPEFYREALGTKQSRGIRMYLNKPNAKGIHIHKDLYNKSGPPRKIGISIPISANALISDLNFYNDELDLVETVRYRAKTPTVINGTVFHEVLHHDHEYIRKVLTISSTRTISEFIDLFNRGRIIQ